jgi:hypothetical protein
VNLPNAKFNIFTFSINSVPGKIFVYLGKCFIELNVGRLFVTDISPEFRDFLKKSFENRIEVEKEENLES